MTVMALFNSVVTLPVVGYVWVCDTDCQFYHQFEQVVSPLLGKKEYGCFSKLESLTSITLGQFGQPGTKWQEGSQIPLWNHI